MVFVAQWNKSKPNINRLKYIPHRSNALIHYCKQFLMELD